MADSARGVSKTRSSPNSFWSPSVTRNTPPFRPTSSPRTRVRESSRSASRNARLRAWTRLTSAILGPARPQPADLVQLSLEVGRELRVSEAEEVVDGDGSPRGDPGAHLCQLLLDARLDPLEEVRAGHGLRLQEAPVAVDGVAPPPALDLVLVAIAARVVGRGVGPDAVGERLDQGRGAVLPGPGPRLPRGP